MDVQLWQQTFTSKRSGTHNPFSQDFLLVHGTVKWESSASNETKRVGQQYEGLAADTLGVGAAAAGVDAMASHARVESARWVPREMKMEAGTGEVERAERARRAKTYGRLGWF